ncbi:MAG: type I glutamate--ammonia ligase [Candidatus Hodarchaeales archaeon]|jgi:glutamine synthetase
MNITNIVETIDQEQVKEIAMQFTDLSGVLHTLWIPSTHFPEIIKEGTHTDGSSFGMVDVSKSDLKLIPDLDSFVVLPSELFPQKVARVICDIFHPESDKPFELDPRYILKKVCKDVNQTLGPSVVGVTSSEIEFFLFKKQEDGQIRLIDEAGYLATPPADQGADLRLEMSDNFRKMGVSIEKHHHEVPHGKSEFNLPYSDAIRMADTIYLVKFIIKLMASKRGLIASFMPKPFHGEYGAGLHTHINLRDIEKNKNLFSDPKGASGLSKMALNFMAGILSHAKALAAITNPSVNSYKRLVPGWEAPVYISWANFNRSTLIRIPPGKNKAARLEYRPTDGSCNFYLAYAGLISAGIDGIKKELDPPVPVEENIYAMTDDERTAKGIQVLPGNLGEALSEFAKDSFFEKSLGASFYESYREIKEKEWKNFSVHVHEWERKRYLNV